jgi:hypothetical protein
MSLPSSVRDDVKRAGHQPPVREMTPDPSVPPVAAFIKADGAGTFSPFKPAPLMAFPSHTVALLLAPLYVLVRSGCARLSVFDSRAEMKGLQRSMRFGRESFLRRGSGGSGVYLVSTCLSRWYPRLAS